jgi:pyruvate kinase
MPASHREPLNRVRTKIVATVGPASREPGTLRELIEAGVDVFRLNFSHGMQEEHTAMLAEIHAAAADCRRLVGVLQDLGGPKIRLGPIPGDAVDCHLDDEFTLVKEPSSDNPHQLTCTYRDLPDDLKPGNVVYFADGVVAMAVTAGGNGTGAARMSVTLSGRIRSGQGINLPGAAINVKALTDKDLHDLDWTAHHPVQYVGLSFVREASDVLRLRGELERRGCAAKIVAKIEKPQAVENLDAIIAEADTVMVARGDLGVEMDVAHVPVVQKQVIAACHAARVPVITATQMLNSMETSNRPTRAEASDVFNAVLDGSDAVMLSGETAIGSYPVEAVATMSRIAAEAETLLQIAPVAAAHWAQLGCRPASTGPCEGDAGWVQPITESVVEAVRLVSRRVGAKLVIVATHSGRTALALSKQRYGPPTLALTDDPNIASAMTLYWGVTPLIAPEVADPEKARLFALHWARDRALIQTGEYVIIVQGTMPNHSSHNAMEVLVAE